MHLPVAPTVQSASRVDPTTVGKLQHFFVYVRSDLRVIATLREVVGLSRADRTNAPSQPEHGLDQAKVARVQLRSSRTAPLALATAGERADATCPSTVLLFECTERSPGQCSRFRTDRRHGT